MYKISSNLTYFSKKIFPWIIISAVCIICLIYLIFEAQLAFLIMGFCISLVCLLIWIICMKNLQTVYLKDNNLIFNSDIVPFNKIISINKYLLAPVYKIKYYKGSGIESFIFQPKFYLPIFEHGYIKEIKKDIKIRENNVKN